MSFSTLHTLFSAHTTLQLLVLMAFATGAGAWLGRIKFGSFSLGMGGVLFVALFFGWMVPDINLSACDTLRDFGLVLFIYTIGIEVGPGFFNSLKKDGALLCALASVVVLLGIAISLLLYKTGMMSIVGATGVLCGSVTNLPSLAAAQNVLEHLPRGAEHAGELVASAAAAYPPGMFIVVLVVQLLASTLHIDFGAEEKDYISSNSAGLDLVNCVVADAAGKTIGMVAAELDIVISRLKRGERIWVPRADETLRHGDIVLAVCRAASLEKAVAGLGKASQTDLRNEECGIDFELMTVTSHAVFGRTLGKLDFASHNGAIVTRVTRAGAEMKASPDIALEFGDRVMVVGPSASRDAVRAVVGDRASELNKTDPVALFCGITLGLLLGMVPIPIPGLPLPVRLGAAGGPIIVSLLLGRLGSTGGLVWRMPLAVNLVLREVGIMLFFAAVGLQSGAGFVSALAAGQGFKWMLCSFLVAFPPVLIVGLFARLVFKMNFLRACGMLAGATTNPPAIVYANSLTSTDAPAGASATVYPLTTLLRITSAQLLIMIFYR
jgi:putative transport protein